MKHEIIEKPGIEDCVVIEQDDDAPAEKWEFKILEKKGKAVTAYLARKKGQTKWQGLKDPTEDESNLAHLALSRFVFEMMQS